ncbi:MAG: heavy metal translocating P-type ATPase [Halobacteriaceae archaeon]
MTDCTLCGLPTPADPVTADDVAGSFCCQGCLAVARTLDDPAAADAQDALDTADTDPEDADGETAFLSVEGMHCATCEAFLEARATDHSAVTAAAASYPTATMKVTYDPDRLSADEVPELVEGTGYRAHAAGEDQPDASDDHARLLVGGFFGMMVMLWYVLFLYPLYLGVPAEDLLMDVTSSVGTYLLANVAVLAAVVLGYTGGPILRGAYVSARAGRPNMDLLVGLAAATAYLYSVVAMLSGRVEVYFDVAVVVVLAVSIGDYYESRIRAGATARLADLARGRADEARRRTDDGTETVALDALRPGDEVVVRTGERVPVDGTVVEGTAAVDESLMTGESTPVRVDPGDDAVGGTVVTDGAVVLEVGPDAESTADRLLRLLWDVQAARPGVQRLVDRVAAAFVPLVVVLAGGTTAWYLLGGTPLGAALLTGLAVLVVSCPCALGLATPLAVSAGIRSALDRGVVVTDAATFERATDADVVVLDKTGTLTTGAMRVADVVGADDALGRAAAVERRSEHPVAEAIVDVADPPDATVSDFERFPGRGVAGTVDGTRVLVGSPTLFDAEGWTVPDRFTDAVAAARDEGRVGTLVGWDGTARAAVTLADEPRPGWEDAVTALGDGREVVVLTGDSDGAAERFREHDAVDRVFAGVPPDGKVETVQRLRAEGVTVMVGDGSNDAGALAAADLGVAMAEGTALAADAADAVVTTDDLGAVTALFDVTAATKRRVRQNLAWAFCYNAVAVPLAVAGVLTPLFAAGAMATSSLLVVANSTRSL